MLGLLSLPQAMTASPVLGSANFIPVPLNGYANGWARLDFFGTNAEATGLAAVSGQGVNLSTGATASGVPPNQRGLPVIGFMVRTLINGLLGCTTFGGSAGVCAGSYGALLDHRYIRTSTPLP